MPLYINPSSNPLVDADAWSRFLTATWVFARYLWLLIFPHNLSADYSFNEIQLVTGLFSGRALVSLAALILRSGRGYRRAGRRFSSSAGSSSYLPSFLPRTGCVPSELSWPSGSFIFHPWDSPAPLPISCAKASNGRSGGPPPRSVLSCSSWAMRVRTLDRNFYWKDHYQLFGSAVRASPNSSLVQANYAAILLNVKNQPRGAVEHALKAIEILPADPSARLYPGVKPICASVNGSGRRRLFRR